ncbi:nucleoside deaminase [Stackebrandtia nassauensis]|uniref:CMP/dCMP deaminase zinc-binding protein n=1 Tax=Stackebrandtia nassauensis (strain DSM 44728 / CIP 108903 / NRRL B-16338 / NBRC 102104 / LLR-40K-21) TaxID=446470 RepID=D3PXE0_STANL|nr:nucleoside deaminase [Stackebrandtia nassauensis]ADD41403.1 CMP/dCMP deaminase zinc-binding protein [Stackebrandtia nassauensis DSM 44728]
MSVGSLTETDRQHLRRCVDLAREALDAGDDPFGSLLVDGAGVVRREERNRERSVDATCHPEFALAKWAGANLSPDERRDSVVYTSGEHCPMCSAAHAWVGLGRIVYVASSAQLTAWRREQGFGPGPVASLSIRDVAPAIPVAGPEPSLQEEIFALHRRAAARA